MAGIRPSSSGKQTEKKRVTQTIAAASTATVTVTWDNAFPDVNYTYSATVRDANGQSDLRKLVETTKTETGIAVRVQNTHATSTRDAVVEAIAIAD